MAAADPFVVIAAGRCPFTTDGPAGAGRSGGPAPRAAGRRPGCKDDYAVNVKADYAVAGSLRVIRLACAVLILARNYLRNAGDTPLAVRAPGSMSGKIILTVIGMRRRHGQAAGRTGPKEAALAEARCLNPHPEQVTDPEFLASEFFDARDAVQVKYEMVRQGQGRRRPGHRGGRGVRVLPAVVLPGGRRAGALRAGGAGAGPARAARRRTSSPRRSSPGPSSSWPPTPRCARRSCRA